MKNLLLIIVFSIGLISCSTMTPPVVVADSFNKKFVSATKVGWDQENPTEWEAEFKMEGKSMSASFNNEGIWLETEIELKEKEIPSVAIEALKKKFTSYEIEEAFIISTPDFKGYEIMIEVEEEEIEVLISDDGIITIKEETEQD